MDKEVHNLQKDNQKLGVEIADVITVVRELNQNKQLLMSTLLIK